MMENKVEKTLILIKPDAFINGKVGKIFTMITSQVNSQILSERFYNCGDPELHRLIPKHYEEHAGKPFYGKLVGFMTCGPVIACVIGGHNVVIEIRNLVGNTDTSKAHPRTIRGIFGHSGHGPMHENLVHASDSVKSAEKEIKIWGFENV